MREVDLAFVKVVYICRRRIELEHLRDEERMEIIEKEMIQIDWDRLPEEGPYDFRDYFKNNHPEHQNRILVRNRR